LFDFLKQPPADSSARELRALLLEQRRTNKLLQGLVYGAIGFVLGLIVMQILVRVRVF
jgi:ubiquinone biosynthesis protein